METTAPRWVRQRQGMGGGWLAERGVGEGHEFGENYFEFDLSSAWWGTWRESVALSFSRK